MVCRRDRRTGSWEIGGDRGNRGRDGRGGLVLISSWIRGSCDKDIEDGLIRFNSNWVNIHKWIEWSYQIFMVLATVHLRIDLASNLIWLSLIIGRLDLRVGEIWKRNREFQAEIKFFIIITLRYLYGEEDSVWTHHSYIYFVVFQFHKTSTTMASVIAASSMNQAPVRRLMMKMAEEPQITKLRTFPARNYEVSSAKSAPVEKSTSALIQAIEKNSNLLNGLNLKRVEAQTKMSNEFFGKQNALALASPLGHSSAPIIKNWYDETVVEEEELKKGRIQKENGPSNGTGKFVRTRQEPRLMSLAIEEIISSLKDLIEVPVLEETTSSEKKKKGYKTALQARKKIVNTLARNGKMIKAFRLTLSDFTSVAKPRPSKAGTDKGKFSKNSIALVVREPPVKR
ncbi:unnamed protein product [Cochlearia groenlandica]